MAGCGYWCRREGLFLVIVAVQRLGKGKFTFFVYKAANDVLVFGREGGDCGGSSAVLW
jgi:hypothetical protein